MRAHCHYEVIRALPKQVWVCTRIGDNDMQAGKQGAKRWLPEKVTGMKDPGDHSLCVIAHIRGLIVELIPLNEEEDAAIFQDEFATRMIAAHEGEGENLKYFGIDLFSHACKTITEFDASREKKNPLDEVRRLNETMTVEDV